MLFAAGCIVQAMHGIVLRVATGKAFTDFDLDAFVSTLNAGQVTVLCGALTMLELDTQSEACDVSLGLEFTLTVQSTVQLMFAGGSLDGVRPASAAASVYAYADDAYALFRTRRVGADLEAEPLGAADNAPKSWSTTKSDISCRPPGAARCAVPFVTVASCQL